MTNSFYDSQMLQALKLLKYLKYPEVFDLSVQENGYCFACGLRTQFKKGDALLPALVETWKISQEIKKAFDKRESMWCSNCGNSFRTRQLAKALVKVFGQGRVSSLKEVANLNSFKKLKIGEINSCGNLHQFLENLPNLYYSEYQEFQKFGGVRNEDLQNLSYTKNFFDLIITSETLEHIPNLNNALKEIHRVLKPSGHHIFTTPVIFGSKTVNRILVDDKGESHKLLSDSFHGSGEEDNIVYREFGIDILSLLERSNFRTNIYFYSLIKDNYAFVFSCRKV